MSLMNCSAPNAPTAECCFSRIDIPASLAANSQKKLLDKAFWKDYKNPHQTNHTRHATLLLLT
jgi:hypothetical protein